MLAYQNCPGRMCCRLGNGGEFKRETGGWLPTRLAFQRGDQVLAMASLGMRKVGPFKVMYVSKGPALDYDDVELFEMVLGELERRANSLGVIWLKIDPDVIAARGLPGSEEDQPDEIGSQIAQLLGERGWGFSGSQVQFRNTFDHRFAPF